MFSFNTTPAGFSIHPAFIADESPIDMEIDEAAFDPSNLFRERTEDTPPSPPLFASERVVEAFSQKAKRAKTEDSDETASLSLNPEEEFDFEEIDSGEDEDDDSDEHSTAEANDVTLFASNSAFSPTGALPSLSKKMKLSEDSSSESSSSISPAPLPKNFQPRILESMVQFGEDRCAERSLHDLVRHANFLSNISEQYMEECSTDHYNKEVEEDPAKRNKYKKRARAYQVISSEADSALQSCEKIIASRLLYIHRIV